MIDDTLADGHALWVADVDGDGDDEVFAGHRGKDHRVSLYDYRPGQEDLGIEPCSTTTSPRRTSGAATSTATACPTSSLSAGRRITSSGIGSGGRKVGAIYRTGEVS